MQGQKLKKLQGIGVNGTICAEIFYSDQIDGGGELKEEVVKEAGVDYSDYGVTDEEMQRSYGK